jgi:hypothetical protein
MVSGQGFGKCPSWLLHGTIPEFTQREYGKPETEIWTGCLLSVSLEVYRYTDLLTSFIINRLNVYKKIKKKDLPVTRKNPFHLNKAKRYIKNWSHISTRKTKIMLTNVRMKIIKRISILSPLSLLHKKYRLIKSARVCVSTPLPPVKFK